MKVEPQLQLKKHKSKEMERKSLIFTTQFFAQQKAAQIGSRK